ncbi:MAG: HAMP domain-containing protein [Polyangiales bacterium]
MPSLRTKLAVAGAMVAVMIALIGGLGLRAVGTSADALATAAAAASPSDPHRPALREAHDQAAAARATLGGLTALFALAALGLAILVDARLASPLRALTHALEGVAEGDLDREVSHRGDDELGRMAQALRETQRTLQERARFAEALARGDLGARCAPRGSGDVLAVSLGRAADATRDSLERCRALLVAARDGRLDARAAHVRTITRLKGKFEQSFARWSAHPRLRSDALDRVGSTARAFAALDREFVPALERGDAAEADRVFAERLSPLYAPRSTRPSKRSPCRTRSAPRGLTSRRCRSSATAAPA